MQRSAPSGVSAERRPNAFHPDDGSPHYQKPGCCSLYRSRKLEDVYFPHSLMCTDQSSHGKNGKESTDCRCRARVCLVNRERGELLPSSHEIRLRRPSSTGIPAFVEAPYCQTIHQTDPVKGKREQWINTYADHRNIRSSLDHIESPPSEASFSGPKQRNQHSGE